MLHSNHNNYIQYILNLEDDIDEVLQLGIEKSLKSCKIEGDIFQSSIDFINEREETSNLVSQLHSSMLQNFK